MKIIFKHFSGSKIELEGVTKETTLREIKKFYEAKTGSRRHGYSFFINNKRGPVNANSLMTFSNYLHEIHAIEFDQNSTLEVLVTLNLGNNNTFFSHKISLPANAENVSHLVCGITLEPIAGMPVKINGRYYDNEAFATFLMSEQDKYFQAKESGYNYTPVCPIRQPLPGLLQKAVIFPLHFNDPAIRRGNLLGFLNILFDETIEQYEDDLVLSCSK